MKQSIQGTSFVEGILDWAKSELRHFPWRNQVPPKHILIAEILLQKTPADRVSQRFHEVIDIYDCDPLSINEEGLIERFKSFGLTKRFIWIKRSLMQIKQRHGGVVPCTYQDLLKLQGVGEYTANAILCLAFGKAVPMIDTNALRVLSRFFFAEERQGKTIKPELYHLAKTLVPIDNSRTYNLGLLDFGAKVCKNTPLCEECPLSNQCEWLNIRCD